jgi:glycosyltransferase involved in cell wall biosynthesis
VIFNGVDIGKYDFVRRTATDAPLVFLGRLERFKGAHHAIAIARRARRRLIIAGNRVKNGPADDYFDREIAPKVDGADVIYLGPVDDTQKNTLLGYAAALLMPIEWEEPFGIVMAEAMACGTPVIGFARGSLPEVIREGMNGYLCGTVDEAVSAIGRLDRIDRAAVRSDCEARFSDRAIVDAYELLYREMVV